MCQISQQNFQKACLNWAQAILKGSYHLKMNINILLSSTFLAEFLDPVILCWVIITEEFRKDSSRSQCSNEYCTVTLYNVSIVGNAYHAINMAILRPEKGAHTPKTCCHDTHYSSPKFPVAASSLLLLRATWAFPLDTCMVTPLQFYSIIEVTQNIPTCLRSAAGSAHDLVLQSKTDGHRSVMKDLTAFQLTSGVATSTDL